MPVVVRRIGPWRFCIGGKGVGGAWRGRRKGRRWVRRVRMATRWGGELAWMGGGRGCRWRGGDGEVEVGSTSFLVLGLALSRPGSLVLAQGSEVGTIEPGGG